MDELRKTKQILIILALLIITSMACGITLPPPQVRIVTQIVPVTQVIVVTQFVPVTQDVPSVNITLPARAGWVDTAISVESGQTLTVAASGVVNLRGGTPEANSDSDGMPLNNCPESGCLLQGEPLGVLIGKIGNGQPFRIGTAQEISISTSGRFYLAVNDSYYPDNSGNFLVRLTVR